MLISLGADASVHVVYKPVQRHREQTGFIAKNVLYTYKQVTEITNNRLEVARVTFTDQIPHSKNEKLKVNRCHDVAYNKTSWLVVAVSLVLNYCSYSSCMACFSMWQIIPSTSGMLIMILYSVYYYCLFPGDLTGTSADQTQARPPTTKPSPDLQEPCCVGHGAKAEGVSHTHSQVYSGIPAE